MHRHSRLAALIAIAVGLGACETTGQLAGDSAAPVTVAFEGFVGVPQEAGDRIAAELLRATQGRRFTLVAPTDRSARYSLRGYVSPQTENGATSVSYVWDVFDRSGQRLRRAAGETRLALAPSDPWQALAGPGGRVFAVQGVDAIERALSAPPTARTPAPTPAAAPAPAPEASTATASNTTPPAPTPQRPAGRRVALENVTGLDAAQEAQLRAAARRMLPDAGYTFVEPGQPADARLVAEATVNPAERGRRKLAVVWHVADGSRRELGQIRQFTYVDEGVFPGRGERTLRTSVEKALPGLVALVPPRS